MNFYLTGIEGIPKLLDYYDEPMAYFKKKLYADAFQKMYQDNVPTLDAIEQGYQSVIDKEQFLTNMANALTGHAAEKMDACKKKSARERLMMDLNMEMAVFVLPVILEYHGQSSKLLSDKIVASWKERFPKASIQAAEFSFIESGFHKKFCYITTAVCETFGKEDDCIELTTLRDYRDQYLAALPGGEELIQQYYDVAPTIVKHINQQPGANEIYRSIWNTYLSPCLAMIQENRLEDCRVCYEDMVHTLQDQYFNLISDSCYEVMSK